MAAAVLFALGGCARSPEDGWSAVSAERVFSAGYGNLAERYLEPVDLGRVAINGLSRLTTVDPGLRVERRAERVRLIHRDTPVAEAPLGGPGDADGWARLTGEFLDAARRVSAPVREQSAEQLYEQVFRGALAGLDIYSHYASAEAARLMREHRHGFIGVGVTISYDGGITRVVRVHEDTPAAQAGIRIDDVITAVDGITIRGMEHSEVTLRLSGPLDSQVRLNLIRETTAEQIDVVMTRVRIVPTTVLSEYRDGVLFVRITGFNQKTSDSLLQVLTAAEQMEAARRPRGIVLDLRDNPGGLLDQAVAVTDLFLGDGRIATTRGRHPDSLQTFDAHDGEHLEALPMAILVNGKSASATEILAAALSERGRAVAVGSSSFGKGSVQTIIRLPNRGELVLTWSRLYGPSGAGLNGRGVVPALCTGTDGESAALLLALRAGGGTANTILGNAAAAMQGDRLPERAACPPSPDIHVADIEIARMLVMDRALYARLVRGKQPTIAQRQPPPGS